MREIEIKILDVDELVIAKKLKLLGATKIGRNMLTVNWFRLPNKVTEWYLRVRKYSNGHCEITWKGMSMARGKSRSVPEINVNVSSLDDTREIFLHLGLEHYATQEKFRTSWTYNAVKFDLDTYPNMPPFLEIEGPNDKIITSMIESLGLQTHKTWNDGERTLIENVYNLDWNTMSFAPPGKDTGRK